MGAKKTGHGCPRHSGQLALPSHEAAATFQKEATGPWRRVVFKAESCNTAVTSHSFKLASRWPVVRVWMEAQGAQDPWALQPRGPAPRHPCGPSWQRGGGLGAHCDSGPARGSYPALCGSPCTPFWTRAWLPVTLTQRPPRHVFGAPSLHHPCQVGGNLSPSWESPEGK